MKKTVCSAEINKCAEISDILDGSFYYIANLQSSEELFLHLSALSHKKLLAVADVSPSVRVVLDDDELNFLILILGEISLIGIRDKRSRNKDTNAFYRYTQAAVKHLINFCGEDFFVVVSFLNSLVAAVSSQSLIGKNNLTVSVINLEDFYLKRITRL